MSVKGGQEVDCPTSLMCNHANHEDHQCSKHVKGVELRVIDYGDPHMYSTHENEQDETTLLGHHSFIHSFIQPTNIYQTPTVYHTL